MTEKEFTLGSVRRIARQLVDLSDPKRKAALVTFPTDIRCKIVEEMVSIRFNRMRDQDGTIQPTKVSER